MVHWTIYGFDSMMANHGLMMGRRELREVYRGREECYLGNKRE